MGRKPPQGAVTTPKKIYLTLRPRQQPPNIGAVLEDDDIVFITADHGCDPTYKGTDHTREQVPVLVYGENWLPTNLGTRKTFADISATILRYFEIENKLHGTPF